MLRIAAYGGALLLGLCAAFLIARASSRAPTDPLAGTIRTLATTGPKRLPAIPRLQHVETLPTFPTQARSIPTTTTISTGRGQLDQTLSTATRTNRTSTTTVVHSN